MSNSLRSLSVVVALVVAATALPAGAATLDNLQAAYNGESNAHARYLAFAEKADSEGYGAVASLFRAAGRAEEVHAGAHAEVIRSLGGEPEAKIEAPKVGTTAENLKAAIEGESYERDTMYPEFLAAARAEGQKAAVQSFTYAKTAEAEHAKLYGDALTKLDTLKGSSGVTYWVCTVCGYTVPKLDFQKCPSCFNPKDKYIAVA